MLVLDHNDDEVLSLIGLLLAAISEKTQDRQDLLRFKL